MNKDMNSVVDSDFETIRQTNILGYNGLNENHRDLFDKFMMNFYIIGYSKKYQPYKVFFSRVENYLVVAFSNNKLVLRVESPNKWY
jgi:hypothetical protein